MEATNTTAAAREDRDAIFAIVPIPGKGLGMLATIPIEPGTVIYQESPVMKIPQAGHLYTAADLDAAFVQLSATQKREVRDLYHHAHPPDDHSSSTPTTSSSSSSEKEPEHEAFSRQLMSIFKSNAFGDGASTWLHPTIARINHSCIPNATTINDPCCIGEDVQIIAERHISAGEEICISYNADLYEGLTARERRVLIGSQFSFECGCEACSRGDEGGLSDGRRVLIAELKGRAEGRRLCEEGRETLRGLGGDGDEEEMEVSNLPADRFYLEQKALESNVTASERTTYHLLLAELREAEGLPATVVASNYWRASEAMEKQMRGLDSITILGWAANIRKWMEKAITIMDRVRSPYDHEPQTLRKAWKTMQSSEGLKLALAFLDGKLQSSAETVDETIFAVEIVSQIDNTFRTLSEDEFRARLRGNIQPVSQDELPNISPLQAPRRLRSRVIERWHNSNKTVGVVGALTCIAPMAAYWMLT